MSGFYTFEHWYFVFFETGGRESRVGGSSRGWDCGADAASLRRRKVCSWIIAQTGCIVCMTKLGPLLLGKDRVLVVCPKCSCSGPSSRAKIESWWCLPQFFHFFHEHVKTSKPNLQHYIFVLRSSASSSHISSWAQESFTAHPKRRKRRRKMKVRCYCNSKGVKK